MTSRSPRSPIRRRPRVRVALILAVISLVAMMALAPGVMAGGGTVVVTTLPGGGWIESLDNTAGGSVQFVAGPGPGTLGTGSLQLTTAATADFAGVAHPFLATGIPYAELSAASWRTFITTATATDVPSLRLSGYQDGVIPLGDFTTLVVERVYQPGLLITPNIWQDNALADTTMVWQTTDSGDGFCLNAGSSPLCTFAAFKAQYPAGRFTAVQVAIGTDIPAATSYADGVSVTTLVNAAPVVETWDFEAAAAPAASIPSTSMAVPSASPGTAAIIVFGSLALLSSLTIAVVQRRRLSR